MGFFLQVVCAGFLASLFSALLPHVLRLVKPYAVRAAGVVPSGWLVTFVTFCTGITVGIALCSMSLFVSHFPVKWPTIDWTIDSPSDPTPPTPTKPTAVTYVYEKDSGGIPSGVAAGLSKLNAQGILATAFEEDTTDGSGETPEQYKVAKEAATKAGLPALVIQAGNVATKVVKGPTTEEHVTEAAK